MKMLSAIVAGILALTAPGLVARAAGTDFSGAVPPELIKDADAAKDAFEHSRYADAEKIYERMLAAAPNNVYVLGNLGVVYFRNHEYKPAEAVLKEATAIAPKDGFAYVILGIVYDKEKRFGEAIKALDRATAIAPKSSYAFMNLAFVYVSQEPPDKEAARKCYNRAIELGADPEPKLAGLLGVDIPWVGAPPR
jgi:tetratricopeptide (TPR) repeat protein